MNRFQEVGVYKQAGRQRDNQQQRGRYLHSRQHVDLPHRKPLLEQTIVSARERSVRVDVDYFAAKSTGGSGVIVQTGLVISNWHLVGDRGFTQVKINDHPAEVIHFDIIHDLVLLAGPTRRLRPLKFRLKSLPNQGPRLNCIPTDHVFYVGNPLFRNKTIAEGKITKIDHKERVIIADTTPAEGYSGSGLYHQETGELVGIIDALEGTNYNSLIWTIAIPADVVLEFWKFGLAKYQMQTRTKPPAAKSKEEPPPIDDLYVKRIYE